MPNICKYACYQCFCTNVSKMHKVKWEISSPRTLSSIKIIKSRHRRIGCLAQWLWPSRYLLTVARASTTVLECRLAVLQEETVERGQGLCLSGLINYFRTVALFLLMDQNVNF